MPVNFNTHGYNWKKVLREQEIYCALVTPAWHRDPLMQRQYTYAQEIKKTIVLLIQAGTPLPAHADEHIWHVWKTPEELAQLVERVEKEGK